MQAIVMRTYFHPSSIPQHEKPGVATPVGLATCRAVGLAKAEARQRSTGVAAALYLSLFTFLLAAGQVLIQRRFEVPIIAD
jgi:hypothetical protein